MGTHEGLDQTFYHKFGRQGSLARDLLNPAMYYADDLLTHAVDVGFLRQVAESMVGTYNDRWSGMRAVVTPAVSGIAFATVMAEELGLPLLLARKSFGSATRGFVREAAVQSYTHEKVETLGISDRQLDLLSSVLLVDDFLSTGSALLATLQLIRPLSARVEAAVVFSKPALGGARRLEKRNCQVWAYQNLPV